MFLPWPAPTRDVAWGILQPMWILPLGGFLGTTLCLANMLERLCEQALCLLYIARVLS